MNISREYILSKFRSNNLIGFYLLEVYFSKVFNTHIDDKYDILNEEFISLFKYLILNGLHMNLTDQTGETVLTKYIRNILNPEINNFKSYSTSIKNVILFLISVSIPQYISLNYLFNEMDNVLNDFNSEDNNDAILLPYPDNNFKIYTYHETFTDDDIFYYDDDIIQNEENITILDKIQICLDIYEEGKVPKISSWYNKYIGEITFFQMRKMKMLIELFYEIFSKMSIYDFEQLKNSIKDVPDFDFYTDYEFIYENNISWKNYLKNTKKPFIKVYDEILNKWILYHTDETIIGWLINVELDTNLAEKIFNKIKESVSPFYRRKNFLYAYDSIEKMYIKNDENIDLNHNLNSNIKLDSIGKYFMLPFINRNIAEYL